MNQGFALGPAPILNLLFSLKRLCYMREFF